MYIFKIIYQITDITFSLFVCFQNSDVTNSEVCKQVSEETLKEVNNMRGIYCRCLIMKHLVSILYCQPLQQ